jgi:hypothetical protein
MMRDRIVQSEMKPPSPPTVAEEVMQPMGQRMGLGAIAPGGQPQAPQQMPPQMPPQMPQQMPPQGQGLDQVPVPPQMFERQGMANGGIVAFQAGGGTPHRMFEQQGMANGGIVAFQEGGQPPSFANMYSGLTPDLEALAAARKAYMGDFPMESPEERLRRRKEEQALRLMEAGLGIAGGTSPYFAANLKGAMPGIQGYGTDLATQRKEDLARIAAERGEKGKVFEGVMGSRDKAEQRKSAERIAELQASKASNMKQYAIDAIAAEEARKDRPLTKAEEATIRSNANKEYVRLTAALDPRTISAQASMTQAGVAGERATTDKVQAAIKSYTDAFQIKNRGTISKDLRQKIRAAETAEEKGNKDEAQQLRLQIYNSFREAQGLPPSTILPGGTLGVGAAAPAGKPSPPFGFVPE